MIAFTVLGVFGMIIWITIDQVRHQFRIKALEDRIVELESRIVDLEQEPYCECPNHDEDGR